MKQMMGGASSRCAWTQMERQTDSNVLTETNWDKVSVLYQSFNRSDNIPLHHMIQQRQNSSSFIINASLEKNV